MIFQFVGEIADGQFRDIEVDHNGIPPSQYNCAIWKFPEMQLDQAMSAPTAARYEIYHCKYIRGINMNFFFYIHESMSFDEALGRIIYGRHFRL